MSLSTFCQQLKTNDFAKSFPGGFLHGRLQADAPDTRASNKLMDLEVYVYKGKLI